MKLICLVTQSKIDALKETIEQLQRRLTTCFMLKVFHSTYGEKPYILLCIFSIELVQHVLVTKRLMRFGMEQNLLFHTTKFLAILHMCSSTNKCIPSWMLRAPNLCFLNTTLQPKGIDSRSLIQKR